MELPYPPICLFSEEKQTFVRDDFIISEARGNVNDLELLSWKILGRIFFALCHIYGVTDEDSCTKNGELLRRVIMCNFKPFA